MLLRDAWAELQAERRFQEVEGAINSGNHDQALVTHGLSGLQLELKTTLADRAIDAVEDTDDKVFMRRKTRRGFWGLALKAANVIGGTLKDVIPGAGAIKEFKDAAETALDERLPLRQRAKERIRRLLGRRGDRESERVP